MPEAFLEGVLLKCFRNEQFKSVRDKSPLPKYFSVVGASGATALRNRLNRAVIAAESTNWAWILACTPANHLTPTILSKHAVEMAKRFGLKSEVL